MIILPISLPCSFTLFRKVGRMCFLSLGVKGIKSTLRVLACSVVNLARVLSLRNSEKENEMGEAYWRAGNGCQGLRRREGCRTATTILKRLQGNQSQHVIYVEGIDLDKIRPTYYVIFILIASIQEGSETETQRREERPARERTVTPRGHNKWRQTQGLVCQGMTEATRTE